MPLKRAIMPLLTKPDKLARNLGWLTGAEAISRIGRVFAAVILARQLDAAAFGAAALALTVFELTRIFTENGIGAAVIRAREEDVDRTCNTANRIMWVVCLTLTALQIGGAIIVENLLPDRQLGLMIASLSLVYLIMPFGLMHAYMLQRAQNMKRLALVSTSQTTADHILTGLLALSGFGAWAIVLPKLLTAPIWLAGVRWGKPWQARPGAGSAPIGSILRFSGFVLASEVVTASREHADKLIVSGMLGIEALGVYYFAFNAGLGVSSALNRGFLGALYPHLCASADRNGAFRSAVLKLALPLSAAYLAQAAASLVYVPIIFGADWALAAPLVAVICLSGPARLIQDSLRMKARADGHPGLEFWLSGAFTTGVLSALMLATGLGLMAACIASACAASVTSALLFSLTTTKRSISENTDTAMGTSVS